MEPHQENKSAKVVTASGRSRFPLGAIAILGIVAVLGALVGAFNFGRSVQNNQKPSAESLVVRAVTAVERRDFIQRITLHGHVKASFSSAVKSQVSGRVDQVFVGEGDVVKKGDLLLVLNKGDIQRQIDGESRAMEAARLKSERLRSDFAREQQLMDHNLVPKKEFEDMKVDFALAQNDWEIECLKFKNLQEDLSKTSVLAPHDGTILAENVSGEASVSEGTTLMTIADLSRLEITSEISEMDVMKVGVGMPAHLTFDALPDLKLPGQVMFISPAANVTEDQKSARIPMLVRVLGSDPRIRVGLSAEIEIAVSHVEKALSLPNSTVFQDGNLSYVYLSTDGKLSKHGVETGIQDGNYVQIKSGLSENDCVLQRSPMGAVKTDAELPITAITSAQ